MRFYKGCNIRELIDLLCGPCLIQVAIKTLFCIELTPEKVVEFCEEAGLLNALKHENILLCYGVAVMPPAICLVCFNVYHSHSKWMLLFPISNYVAVFFR